ncbi:hypothetical protein LKMONMHP_1651 [Methylobacterium organophilum]|uniref:Helicase HerA central domain-containing protein n=1 Tax=Methylobacterium organophilum TaxID=410 RepID=A0ABQ4T8K9_METOR|nr:hypothetical protein LKMONMHP_1651 [Methylobacterium organophilum]
MPLGETLPDPAFQAASIGSVISIKGSAVTVAIGIDGRPGAPRVTVGSFVGVCAGSAYLVGIVTTLAAELAAGTARSRAELDLLGEIVPTEAGETAFRRGIACHPAIGDRVEPLPAAFLRLVFQPAVAGTVPIGTLYQDAGMPACVTIDDLLSKHFAVLGTTGVGKSSGVAVIVEEILKARADIRIFLLDVHNEYARCFGERASVISPRTLKLPFWLFNLEETVDVIYGGRPPVEDEIEILAELIPLAKAKYAQYKDAPERGLMKRGVARGGGYTVDTPVPYLLQDLIALIDERMGRLENRNSRMHYHRLIGRIETIRNDPRYGFMFENANVGGDMMGELLAHLFRLEPEGRPMTIMQLAGLPVEVVDAVVCVLCRLAFEFGLWSEGAVPLLFVCEEAHRYASADRSVGFTPTRRALSRIAREGRKHGVFLGLVTQRPAELDPTIISQCSTLFAMRMSNERDQAFLAAAVSDATNLLSFVPLLATGEVIAFGEGVPLPARMKFRELPQERRPKSDTLGRSDELDGVSNAAFVGAVVERWRGATMSKGPVEAEAPAQRLLREPLAGAAPVAPAEVPGSAAALDQAHRRLLRRPLDAPASAEAPQPAATDIRAELRAAGSLWQR